MCREAGLVLSGRQENIMWKRQVELGNLSCVVGERVGMGMGERGVSETE
jgi:hypothetical protein